jgi:hypothetical protein
MSLSTIIRRVASEAGINSPDLNTSQRDALIDIINQAAEEVYESKDLPVTLKESYIRVGSDFEVALPAYIGELRAIRPACETQLLMGESWSLMDMRPKYTKAPWPIMWNNWVVKGYYPICNEITNAAPGTIQVDSTDLPVDVTLVGETSSSNKFAETVTVSTPSSVWTKSFLDLKRVAKSALTNCNVVILAPDGTILSIIYADQLEARFVVIDVAKYPNIGCCACDDGTYAMEVLYKPRLGRMVNDEDFFPVDGYEEIVILKTKQLLMEGEEGKEKRALLMHKKASLLISQKVEDRTGFLNKKISFKPNKKLGIVRRHFGYGGNY